MLRRTITGLLLLLFGVPGLIFGGPLFFVVVVFFLVLAAWEYIDISEPGASRASRLLVVGGVFAISAARQFFPTISVSVAVFTFSVLLAMSIHLIEYERGRERAGLDFLASVGGLAYVGWIGAYVFDLRSLQDGGWWIMLVLPIVWMVDSGAYTIGARYGTHQMSPRLSPKKTWEGFWAGAFTGVLSGAFFTYIYSNWGPLRLPVWAGALLGLVIGLLTPLGDLGESMLKRQVGIKDSGNLFPGHGGVFDRIDSWLWATVIGYYFIIWFAR